MLKIFVSSSCKNKYHASVIASLKKTKKYDVYDFTTDSGGSKTFEWTDIDTDYEKWSPKQFVHQLTCIEATDTYNHNYKAMVSTDVFIGVAPFGNSASTELGWAAGAAKFTILLLSEPCKPELMYKLFDYICFSMDEVKQVLQHIEANRNKADNELAVKNVSSLKAFVAGIVHKSISLCEQLTHTESLITLLQKDLANSCEKVKMYKDINDVYVKQLRKNTISFVISYVFMIAAFAYFLYNK